MSGDAHSITSSAGEQRWGHVEAERSCRLRVDGDLELGRLQYRKLCRLGALENWLMIGKNNLLGGCEASACAQRDRMFDAPPGFAVEVGVDVGARRTLEIVASWSFI
jgi:hypothetical protein